MRPNTKPRATKAGAGNYMKPTPCSGWRWVGNQEHPGEDMLLEKIAPLRSTVVALKCLQVFTA